jgi:hypothetical protein
MFASLAMLGVGTTAALTGPASAAVAGSPASPDAAAMARPAAVPQAVATQAAAHGLKVKVFASSTPARSQPDDIVTYGHNIVTGWQNHVGADGTPGPNGVTKSTVTEQNTSGRVLHSWSLTGHVDGLRGDPSHGRILATVNEDAHSSLYVIRPGASAANQVRQYQYNLPDSPQGGTDAVSIYHGQILITASNPVVPTGSVGATAPAVYKVTLSGATAKVRPVFFDNSPATVANVGDPDQGKTVPLALTDPDSNAVVPPSAPRFGGDFMLDSQGNAEQVYVTGATGNRPKLSLLKLSQRVNDTAWVTNPNGTLYVTDTADGEVFTVRGAFPAGGVYTAATPRSTVVGQPNPPNYLATLNMNTGLVTPAITTIQAEGVLFTP